ncbi:hypothetical protein [Gluconobacter oxydans]|nr:hypothetical protein [Gluconobacter oxydans]
MTETFEMFAQAGAQHGGHGIKIEIRLDDLSGSIKTTLEAFRSETRKAEAVMLSSSGKQWGLANINRLWSECWDPTHPADRKQVGAISPVAEWARSYRNWPPRTPGGRMAPPALPTTGDEQFDAVARDALKLMESLTRAVKLLGPTRDARQEIFGTSSREALPALPESWEATKVASLDSDYLAVSLYEMLNHLALTGDYTATEGRNIIRAWQTMIEEVPEGLGPKELADKLLSLLDLPSWKARHQLYAVWTATRIVKQAPWKPKWNIIRDTLNFDFGGAEILRFEAEEAIFILRSELRRPLVGKSAAKRKTGIQPDFTMLNGNDVATSPAHLVVECKQYASYSKRNFRGALSDYSCSHTTADVLLANYGPMRSSAAHGLGSEARAVEGHGLVHPQGEGLAAFDAALKTSFTRAEKIVAQKIEEKEAEFRRIIEEAASAGSVTVTSAPLAAADPILASVSLVWADGGDLDLHVFLDTKIGACEIKFNNRGLANAHPFACLDHDATSGPGQETVTFHAPLQGPVRIEVHLYSGEWPSTQPSIVLKRAGGWTRKIVRPHSETDRPWVVETLDADWLPIGAFPMDSSEE